MTSGYAPPGVPSELNPTAPAVDPEFDRSGDVPVPNAPATTSAVPAVQNAEFDYWGASEEKFFEFPGQESLPENLRQGVFFKTMNEGMRARFQKKTNRPITIEHENQDARMSIDPAGDRAELLKSSIHDWRLKRGGEWIQFKPYHLDQWLKYAPPELVDKIEVFIRDSNPWMLNEMSSEAIRKEIDKLVLKEAEAIKREESEANFGDK